MALEWEISGIKGFEDLCWIKVDKAEWDRLHKGFGPSAFKKDDDGGLWVQNTVTTSLIFRCAAVGFQDITLENYQEFWARCKVVSQLSGAPIVGPDGDVDFKLSDVRDHVGLTTNCFPNKSPDSFVRDQGRYISDMLHRFEVAAKKIEEGATEDTPQAEPGNHHAV